MSVGERVAFGEYVRARSGALLRAAQALTANRADAEDLLQATLVKAYQSWDRSPIRPRWTPTSGGSW